MVKNLSATQEMQICSWVGKNPLEKEMETHSSIFAWEIPWTDEHGGLKPMGLQRAGRDLAFK